MNTNHIRYIYEIFKCGSMSKAAENCFVSQPYLSKIVKSIEKELGFKLLDRSTRGVTFTEDGERFIESAEVILRECTHLQNIRYTTSENQNLRIACSPSALLARLYFAYQSEHNGSLFQDTLLEGGVQQILNHLTSRFIGLGLSALFTRRVEEYQQYSDRYNIEMRVLIDGLPATAVMSRSHPLAQKEEIFLADLSDERLVADPNVGYEDTLKIIDRQQDRGILYVSGRAALFDALQSGRYLAVLLQLPPEVEEEVNLVCRRIHDLEEGMSVILLRSRLHEYTDREQDFISFLETELQTFKRKISSNS